MSTVKDIILEAFHGAKWLIPINIVVLGLVTYSFFGLGAPRGAPKAPKGDLVATFTEAPRGVVNVRLTTIPCAKAPPRPAQEGKYLGRACRTSLGAWTLFDLPNNRKHLEGRTFNRVSDIEKALTDYLLLLGLVGGAWILPRGLQANFLRRHRKEVHDCFFNQVDPVLIEAGEINLIGTPSFQEPEGTCVRKNETWPIYYIAPQQPFYLQWAEWHEYFGPDASFPTVIVDSQEDLACNIVDYLEEHKVYVDFEGALTHKPKLQERAIWVNNKCIAIYRRLESKDPFRGLSEKNEKYFWALVACDYEMRFGIPHKLTSCDDEEVFVWNARYIVGTAKHMLWRNGYFAPPFDY